MKKPQILLITFLLLITSVAFSQSGAAKSLEIGNQWVYRGSNGYTFMIEVKRDTLIDNVIWAIVGNKLQRADTSIIYNYYHNCIIFCHDIDFSTSSESVFLYGSNRKKVTYNLEFSSVYNETEYYHSAYVEGIGLVRYDEWTDNGVYTEELIACRINGIEYGDITYLDVEDDNSLLTDYFLNQNFPNPFNPSTQISYELPTESKVELVIYNMLGKEVVKLVDKNQTVGKYTINWNGRNAQGIQMPGGIYFYTLKTKEFTQTKKMLLLR